MHNLRSHWVISHIPTTFGVLANLVVWDIGKLEFFLEFVAALWLGEAVAQSALVDGGRGLSSCAVDRGGGHKLDVLVLHLYIIVDMLYCRYGIEHKM